MEDKKIVSLAALAALAERAARQHHKKEGK
jgi:hypothetical protein